MTTFSDYYIQDRSSESYALAYDTLKSVPFAKLMEIADRGIGRPEVLTGEEKRIISAFMLVEMDRLITDIPV